MIRLMSQAHAGFLMPALDADPVRRATGLPFATSTDDAGPGSTPPAPARLPATRMRRRVA